MPLWVFLLVSLSCCSCSRNEKPLYPVRGSVSFKGLPVVKAMVVFHSLGDSDPKTVKPRAIISKDGSFQAYTYAAGDGIPAGDYVVTVVGEKSRGQTKKAASATKKKDEAHVRLLPAHYEDPKTSELRAKIQEGANELPPFQLKEK